VERFTFSRLFFLYDEGNGNVRKERYEPPSPEAIERARRERRGKELMSAFEKYLVDTDLTPEQLMQRFMQGPTLEHDYATAEEVAAAHAGLGADDLGAAPAEADDDDPFVARGPVPDTVVTQDEAAEVPVGAYADFAEDENGQEIVDEGEGTPEQEP
jgi:hypothetical protein